MSAGASALREQQSSGSRIAEYERRLREERARERNFAVAHQTEASVGARLAAMDCEGWQLLPDRRWPGTRNANIDMIHVGPGGVLVIDVKAWAEPAVSGGRLYCGQADADDELDKLRRVTEQVLDATTELGLAPTEVRAVMVFANKRIPETRIGAVQLIGEDALVPWATRLGRRLTATQVEAVVNHLAERFPPHDGTSPTPAATIRQPVVPLPPEEPLALFDAVSLEAAMLEQALAAPIEEWMTFLHPEQVKLVRRMGIGPSRIRGAAGTGKTVVALHRAAYVAQASQQPVLFTSFIKTLPPTLSGLYERLSPGTADRVEFVSLHQWARKLLRDRGHRLRIDPPVAETSFWRAWAKLGRGSALDEVGVVPGYWRDEIDYVLKGRGITHFDSYASLRRVGRRTPLQPAHREAVWRLYSEYERLLTEAGIIDFNDLISLALAELSDGPDAPHYAAIIVDEVQDLSCQALRLLAQLGGEGQRLHIVGDGQQQVYPGGYTLAEAGLSVAGRSTVLRTNYRNAANILARSAQVVAEDEFNDLDPASEAGRRGIKAVRGDGVVREVTVASLADLRTQAIEQVVDLIANGHSPAGIAVLCPTNSAANHYVGALRRAGVDALSLADYTGRACEAVKVGTYQRAKGLEFKDVVLPVENRPSTATSLEALQEEVEREHRALFVAMTRARDTLWIGWMRA